MYMTRHVRCMNILRMSGNQYTDLNIIQAGICRNICEADGGQMWQDDTHVVAGCDNSCSDSYFEI